MMEEVEQWRRYKSRGGEVEGAQDEHRMRQAVDGGAHVVGDETRYILGVLLWRQRWASVCAGAQAQE